MKHPVTRELYAYWRNLKGAGAAPAHSEIDWVALRRFAADMFIVQKGPRKDYWISYAGTRVDAYWLDREGQPFFDLWDAADHNGVRLAIESAVDQMAPVVAGARCAPPGASPVDLELMLLPLRRLGHMDAQFLGSLALANAPDWVGRAGLGRLTLMSFRVVREHENPGAARLRRAATPPIIRKPPRQRPRLVLHKGGKC